MGLAATKSSSTLRGNRPASQLRRALTPKGTLVLAEVKAEGGGWGWVFAPRVGGRKEVNGVYALGGLPARRTSRGRP
jgi:hypothetical protein